MTEAEQEQQRLRDQLLVEMAGAVEMMLELTRHAHPSAAMVCIGAVQRQKRLEAVRERFVGSLKNR